MNRIHHAEALDVLKQLPDASIDLVYTDPPFGTQDRQVMRRRKDVEVVSDVGYDDRHDDYMAWLQPHLVELRRVLKPTGTLYLHLDWRWSHYVKVALDATFGRDNFLNEVVWAYDFGGRGRRCWPKKHDVILVYSREPDQHLFNWDAIDRIPYMAPGLQKDPMRAIDGKVPTDVWWMSIVGTQSKERTGYPNQKPVRLVERAVLASSPPGGIVLDPFAGSGTTAAAALLHRRSFIVVDSNPVAVSIMKERFKDVEFEAI